MQCTLSGNKNNFNIVYFPFKFFGDYLSFNGGYTTSDAQKNVSRVGEKKNYVDFILKMAKNQINPNMDNWHFYSHFKSFFLQKSEILPPRYDVGKN